MIRWVWALDPDNAIERMWDSCDYKTEEEARRKAPDPEIERPSLKLFRVCVEEIR